MNNVHFLWQNSALYRANHAVMTLSAHLSTGFPALDKLLPGGGWPTDCVTEVLSRDGRLDPISLLLPALATLSWERRWLALIAPPHMPDAEDLAEQGLDLSRLLVIHRRHGQTPAEIATKALASGHYSAVLLWPETADAFQIGQIQQAAKRGSSTCFVLRPATAMTQPSPAELRVYLTTHSHRLGLEILQCRCAPGVALQIGLDQDDKPVFRPQRLRSQKRMPESCEML